MSDNPVPKVFVQIMCDCGHDLVVDTNASDPGDKITTFNFEGHCSNAPEVCHHRDWQASVSVSELALSADAAAAHETQRRRDSQLAVATKEPEEQDEEEDEEEPEQCGHPVGNGECILPAGHAGVHRLTEA